MPETATNQRTNLEFNFEIDSKFETPENLTRSQPVRLTRSIELAAFVIYQTITIKKEELKTYCTEVLPSDQVFPVISESNG